MRILIQNRRILIGTKPTYPKRLYLDKFPSYEKHIVLLFCSAFANAQEVVYFLDINFKNTLLASNTELDTNHDGEVQVSEAENARDITCSSTVTNITSVVGIERFINLLSFYIGSDNTQLESADFSACRQLVALGLRGSGLASLDVSNMENLINLEVAYCPNLISLNVHGCTALGSLDCIGTPLANPDFRIYHRYIT